MTVERPWYIRFQGNEYFAALILSLSHPDPIVARLIRLVKRGSRERQQYLLRSIVVELALRGQKDCRRFVLQNWKVGLPEGETQLATGYALLRKRASIQFIVAEAQRIARSSDGPVRLRAVQALIPCVLKWEEISEVVRTAIKECPELVSVGGWSLWDGDDQNNHEGTYTTFESVIEGAKDKFFSAFNEKFELNEADLIRLRSAVLEAETDSDRAKLLSVFGQQPWPGDTTNLFEWIKGDDYRLRSKAIEVIAVVAPDALRHFALHLAPHGQDQRRCIAKILNLVGVPDDEFMILEILRLSENAEHRHELTSDITSLVGSAKRGFTTLRHEIYESSEDEFHRSFAVRGLMRTRSLSPELIEECKFDSYHYTQKLAKRAHRSAVRQNAISHT